MLASDRIPTILRHPELVSGSIMPLAQCLADTPKCGREARAARAGQAEKWTLKQVQGDGKFEGGVG
jgi:hypothetical protein